MSDFSSLSFFFLLRLFLLGFLFVLMKHVLLEGWLHCPYFYLQAAGFGATRLFAGLQAAQVLVLQS
jgi:hypothetical protein